MHKYFKLFAANIVKLSNNATILFKAFRIIVAFEPVIK